MKQSLALVVIFGWLAMAGPLPAAETDALDQQIAALQHAWAHIKYQITDEDRQEAEMHALAGRAAALVQKYPGRAEPLIWDAIITSTEAGMSGGLGALSKAKAARAMLLKAEKIDPTALNGSVYTSLGSLYYQVPGFPLGFGSKKKARRYLEKALAINPDGIDPNYFYGDFLYRRHDYAEAARALTHALEAPARPNRPLADQGRRQEIRALLTKVQAHLHSQS